MKLLVRATNWLGDAVVSLPALREIRRVHAGWEIVILARPWVADLYGREGICDRMLPYENTGRHAGILGRWRLSRELRTEGFNRAIFLPNSFDSALPAWLAGIPERIGYARDRRALLLTRAPAPPKKGEIPAHERYYYLEMLRRAGLLEQAAECPEIRLACSAQAAEAGREYWSGKGEHGTRWVGVCPGAANSRAKQWAPERFAEAATEVAKKLNAKVVVFGSGSEVKLGQSIVERVPVPAHNLAGQTTLREFIDLTACCDVFLTNDSGGMHVAAALGVPTVVIFGPTNELTTGPASSSALVVREPVECSPCLLKVCPIDHRCMERVTASRVASEALAFLQRTAMK
jgi:heptosyltransferase-2